MKRNYERALADRKRRVERRLDKNPSIPRIARSRCCRPACSSSWRAAAMGASCAAASRLVQQLVRRLGLAQAIDERLQLFKVHLPYHEDDTVLNLAYNARHLREARSSGPRTARQDEAYLDLLTERIRSDHGRATSAAYTRADLQAALQAYDAAATARCGEQPPRSSSRKLDWKPTEPWCGSPGRVQAGPSCSYQGRWGYHPLVPHPTQQHGRGAAAVNQASVATAEGGEQLTVPCGVLGELPADRRSRRHRLLADRTSIVGMPRGRAVRSAWTSPPGSARGDRATCRTRHLETLERPAKTPASGPSRARPREIKQRLEIDGAASRTSAWSTGSGRAALSTRRPAARPIRAIVARPASRRARRGAFVRDYLSSPTTGRAARPGRSCSRPATVSAGERCPTVKEGAPLPALIGQPVCPNKRTWY